MKKLYLLFLPAIICAIYVSAQQFDSRPPVQPGGQPSFTGINGSSGGSGTNVPGITNQNQYVFSNAGHGTNIHIQNQLEVLYSDGTQHLNVDNGGNFIEQGHAWFRPDNQNEMPLKISNLSGDTTNMTEWQDSSGTILSSVSSNGVFFITPRMDAVRITRINDEGGDNDMTASEGTFMIAHASSSAHDNHVSNNDGSFSTTIFNGAARDNDVQWNQGFGLININDNETNSLWQLGTATLIWEYDDSVNNSNRVASNEAAAIGLFRENSTNCNVIAGHASFTTIAFQGDSPANPIHDTQVTVGAASFYGANLVSADDPQVNGATINVPDGAMWWGYPNTNGLIRFQVDDDGTLSELHADTPDWLGIASGNGSGITNVTANAPTLVRTNFVSGMVYQNTTGRPIQVSALACLTYIGVVGQANLSLRISNTVTNDVGQTTLITSFTGTTTNMITGLVPNGETYTFTNTSTGTGDSATVGKGQYIIF